MTIEERLMERVTRDGDCWVSARTPSQAYAVITIKHEPIYAHRLAYELWVGPIPEGRVVDHVAARGCRSKRCINPAHLEAVTSSENTHRAISDACREGHPYDRTKSNGERYCSICARARWRDQYHRRVRAAATSKENVA